MWWLRGSTRHLIAPSFQPAFTIFATVLSATAEPGTPGAVFAWTGRVPDEPDTPPPPPLDPVEHAAWTQVAATLLASDLAILMY